jgi:hypothetical protein
VVSFPPVAGSGAFAHAGMRLGSSHSPHQRHLAAASWIGSAQYGQGFTTGSR